MTSSDDHASLRHTIRDANAVFMTTVKSGDAGAMAALYSEAALLLPPNHMPVKGSKEITEFWEQGFKAGIREIQLETMEVTPLGDALLEVGNFELIVEGGQVADEGNYIVIWREEGGAWRLDRDIWNSSRRMALD